MPPDTFARLLHVVVGLGLLNVWLLRPRAGSRYRGGSAAPLRQEFAANGLPALAFYVFGALEVSAGVILLAALWLPMPERVAAIIVAGLMIGAMAMHRRVRDPLRKSLPAAAMFAMCVGIIFLPL
jgi:high-affinity Fe2+/Pb2+ permease